MFFDLAISAALGGVTGALLLAGCLFVAPTLRGLCLPRRHANKNEPLLGINFSANAEVALDQLLEEPTFRAASN